MLSIIFLTVLFALLILMVSATKKNWEYLLTEIKHNESEENLLTENKHNESEENHG